MQSCDLSEAPFNREVSEGPQNVEAFWAVAKDGVRLRLAHWRPVEAPKGTIFLLQGRSENLEKYGRTDEKLVEAGYAIFAIDWRGQGLSDRLAEDRMLCVHIAPVGHQSSADQAPRSLANLMGRPSHRASSALCTRNSGRELRPHHPLRQKQTDARSCHV
jgi:alpha-beta hydrolase superfamily lysophospholipase